ncbi:MFS transporter [Endozoicomonas atrinae]|uniref:MFS transporter n=1 Tax=Endozoicomonas atrinae TaxID=1333660 RepID=UPI0008268BF0|nr:MFS transporter [Endozoicomonas atrinae]
MPANVWILFFAQALAMSGTPLMVFAAALASRDIAPSPAWVTLPAALLVAGTACSVYPSAQLARKWGRKHLFMSAMMVGAFAALLAMVALKHDSFIGFSSAALLLGGVIAVCQQFRFAAMESVEKEQMPMAASRLLTAGLISAWLGPELVFFGQYVMDDTFSGAFLLLTGLFIGALAVLGLGYKNNPEDARSYSSSRCSKRLLLKNPGFWIAAASGAVGYGVMSFIMTATPISMHELDQFSLSDTKRVIQSHIMAMFIPSLFAGFLVKALGHIRMIYSGLVILAGCVLVGVIDNSFMHYWWALIALGVAWNFLFVAGTSLLPSVYQPEQKHTAQGLNDTMVFGAQTVGALTSGMALQWLGWTGLLLAMLPVIVAMAGLVAWWQQKRPSEEGHHVGTAGH